MLSTLKNERIFCTISPSADTASSVRRIQPEQLSASVSLALCEPTRQLQHGAVWLFTSPSEVSLPVAIALTESTLTAC